MHGIDMHKGTRSKTKPAGRAYCGIDMHKEKTKETQISGGVLAEPCQRICVAITIGSISMEVRW